jgi:hypothetical protein
MVPPPPPSLLFYNNHRTTTTDCCEQKEDASIVTATTTSKRVEFTNLNSASGAIMYDDSTIMMKEEDALSDIPVPLDEDPTVNRNPTTVGIGGGIRDGSTTDAAGATLVSTNTISMVSTNTTVDAVNTTTNVATGTNHGSVASLIWDTETGTFRFDECSIFLTRFGFVVSPYALRISNIMCC